MFDRLKTPSDMKKLTLLVFAFALLLGLALSTTSCNRGYGCPINENAHIQPNKKGKYPKTRTRSGLFPKDMKKKLKVN